MNVEIHLISIAAPLQITVKVNDIEYFYRERHWRWRVERNNIEIDAGAASDGDSIREGLARIFNNASSLEQLLFYEYDTELTKDMDAANKQATGI